LSWCSESFDLANQGKIMPLLEQLAEKYIWWKSPIDAAQDPATVIAQVMNMGDYSDVLMMTKALGEPTLCSVLQSAQAGQFNAKSWAYWHYRLGLAAVDALPSLPQRGFA
jgi:hypothetical protein